MRKTDSRCGMKGNVLITGIGLCGKSTLRRRLVQHLTRSGIPFHQYDADGFQETRDQRDTWSVLAPEHVQAALDQHEPLTIVEDVHAPQICGGIRPLASYDLIIYVLPVWWAYPLFWLARARRWFESGCYSWKPQTGWKGTGKPKDWRNLPGIIREMLRACRCRKRWIQEDLRAIYHRDVPLQVIESRWTTQGPRFRLDF